MYYEININKLNADCAQGRVCNIKNNSKLRNYADASERKKEIKMICMENKDECGYKFLNKDSAPFSTFCVSKDVLTEKWMQSPHF